MTSRHADHDLQVIAAHAAGDAAGADAPRAQALLDSCGECRQLATDLALLRAATRRLPAPQRSHDFRLSSETAARLRGSPWRRLVAGLTAPRGHGRPLAAALMTLGLAGLMVSAAPLLPLGALTATRDGAPAVLAPSGGGANFGEGRAPEAAPPTSVPGDRTVTDSGASGGTTDGKGAPGASATPAAGASPAVPPAALSGGPSPSAGQPATPAPGTPAPVSGTPGQGQEATGDRAAGSGTGGVDAAGGADGRGWPSPLAIVSAVLLLAGVGILVVRRMVPAPLR